MWNYGNVEAWKREGREKEEIDFKIKIDFRVNLLDCFRVDL